MSGLAGPDRRTVLADALQALDRLQARLQAVERAHNEPIAIIGIGCRFPGGADGPDALWARLRDGVDATRDVPPDRWNVDAFYDPDPEAPGKMYTRRGGFLDRVDEFDAAFFGISPREAARTDPQQRLLLEVAWEALEHAGRSPAELAGTRTGIFVGITAADYGHRLRGQGPARIDAYHLTGTSLNFAAGRLAYVLGVHGPTMAVDTACSSSLVAVDLACRSLRTGDSQLALVAGVNVILSPEGSVTACKARMLAPDGRCKTFDARADGFGRGEGCGVVVLKRLDAALADGDRIVAVIVGSAVNQDGHTSGLTVPNKQAQEALLRAALSSAAVRPADVDYVEAHGTGTPLGDPIEARALAAVLGDGRLPGRPLLVGSVKTNLGHLESAAGIAGLIKVALALERGEIPPHLHLRELNPYIAWGELPLAVPTTRTPWPADGRRYGGVSSFGASGTNAHVLLTRAPTPVPDQETAEPSRQLLPLSARTGEALRELAARYARALADRPELALRDVCFTAAVGRAHLAHRLAVPAGSTDELRARLAAVGDGDLPGGVSRGRVGSADTPTVAFLFTGQGAQRVGMGRQLDETDRGFRRTLDRCDEILAPWLGRSLRSVLYPAAGTASVLDDTAFTQPALFALEYALAEWWRARGVVPSAVLGHSVGEYVAACVAGVFGLEDGLALVTARGRLMQDLPDPGGMTAVWADEATVVAAIASVPSMAIAAVNGPHSVVVAGRRDALEMVEEKLAAANIRTRRLSVSHAFHSPLMDPMLEAFERRAERVTYAPPRLPLISNVTGAAAGAEVATASYWRRHVRAPVRFAAGVTTLLAQGHRIFLEIGPAPTLLGLARLSTQDDAAAWLPSLRPGRIDDEQLLESLGELYVRGVPIDWSRSYAGAGARRVGLPTYPFARERHWISPVQDAPAPTVVEATSGTAAHPLLGRRLQTAVVTFESRLSALAPAFLGDHRVGARSVMPFAGYVEIAAAALHDAPCVVEDMIVPRPLALSDGHDHAVQTVLLDDPGHGRTFRILSRPLADESADAWTLHASGRLTAQAAGSPRVDPLVDVRARCPIEVPVEAHHRALRERGLHFGPSFHGVRGLWRGEAEAIARVELPAGLVGETPAYRVHPALLDACLQAAAGVLPEGEASGVAWLPIGFDRFALLVSPGASAWSHVRRRPDTGSRAEVVTADVTVYDDDGAVVAVVDGLRVARVEVDGVDGDRADGPPTRPYRVAWVARALADAARAGDDGPGASTGTWIVLDDSSGLGVRLVGELGRDGQRCLVVRPGARHAGVGSEPWRIEARGADVAWLLREAAATGPVRGVLHLWGLDACDPADTARDEGGERRACEVLLELVRGLDAAPGLAPALWIVTRGAQAAGADAHPVALAQAGLWGLGRVVAVERPDLAPTLIDLDPAGDADEGRRVAEEVRRGQEPHVALRTGVRYVARLLDANLAEGGATPPPTGAAGWRLASREPGVLDGIALEPLRRRAPGAGEVEIAVACAGLNFRDVLTALGMYPGDAGPLGSECAGEIVAVGEGVTRLRVGDAVMAVVTATSAFASFVTTPASLVVPIPHGLSLEEASAAPIAYLTAHFALHHLAGMRAGDRVLIHAAAGGVGLAAVHVARRAGAEVFATAGSAEKRAFLAALGVDHVMDSRSLAFADEIAAKTGARGVDIVLNSLTGDFIVRSLGALAPGGRFVEIGKREIWSPARVAAHRPDVSYHAFYLGDLCDRQPELVRETLQRLAEELASGTLPRLRLRTFAIEDAAHAFRHMAKARHIGKVVLSLAGPTRLVAIRPDASYLVTGGLGGLGLQVARWLVARGARTVVLASRRPPDPAAAEALAALERDGARVLAVSADVADDRQVAGLLARVRAELPPLRGVIHAAGVLDDAALADQSWSRFRTVRAPKVDGAWNLHVHTRDLALDLFALFSSASALLGWEGQANYAAANCFLDALAHHRRATGLRALSLNWGPWASAGMASAGTADHERRRRGHGLGAIRPSEVARALDQMLRTDLPQVAVLPVDWSAYGSRRERHRSTLLETVLHGAVPTVGERPPSAMRTLAGRLEAVPASQRLGVVEALVREEVARVLGVGAPETIDPHAGLRDMGLDSLMAIELRNALQAGLERRLPATLAFDFPTVATLAGHLASHVLGLDPSAAAGDVDGRADAKAAELESIRQLSDVEAEALLAQELDAGQSHGGGRERP